MSFCVYSTLHTLQFELMANDGDDDDGGGGGGNCAVRLRWRREWFVLCKLAGSSRLSNPPLHKYHIYMYINQTEAFAAVPTDTPFYLNCSVFVLFCSVRCHTWCCVAFFFLALYKSWIFYNVSRTSSGSKHKKVFGKMWQTRDLCRRRRRRRRMNGMNA